MLLHSSTSKMCRCQSLRSLSSLANLSSIIYSITSIILSHFILDLRSVYLTDASGNSTTTSTRSSSLHFVSGVEENLGATVNTPWSSEERDQSEDSVEEDIQYSEYPFSTGLASIKDNVITADASELPEAGWVPLHYFYQSNQRPDYGSSPSSTTAGMTEEIELSHIV